MEIGDLEVLGIKYYSDRKRIMGKISEFLKYYSIMFIVSLI